MKTPCILPKRQLQRFFCASLEEDFRLDLAAIKKDLPAVYWQLPCATLSQENNSAKQPTVKVSSCILQQKLWFESTVFSEIIMLVKQDEIELLYIQLLPQQPPEVQSSHNDYSRKFLKKYILCIRRTLENLEKFATASEISKISTTILNPRLAEVFKLSGYELNPKDNSTTSLPIDQFILVRHVTHQT